MYHFIFIDEASSENEQGRSAKQERNSAQMMKKAEQENKSVNKILPFPAKNIHEETREKGNNN